MSAHTPGPWIVDDGTKWGFCTVAHVDSKRIVFNEARGTVALGDPEADARLIAAAPDLYDALNALVTSLDCIGRTKEDWDRVLNKALSALAKAEGRS